MKKILMLSTVIFITHNLYSAETSKKTHPMQRKSKDLEDLDLRFKTLVADLAEAIEDLDPVRIRFAEFEPETPSTQEIAIHNLSIYFECTPENKVSIIFKPNNLSSTPTKNNLDFGDITVDQNFDTLKRNLPKDPDAPQRLLIAILAKKGRIYLQAVKAGDFNQLSDAERTINIAKFHRQPRIAEIIENINKHRKYHEETFHTYDRELAKFQKTVDETLQKAGFKLFKSGSQDL